MKQKKVVRAKYLLQTLPNGDERVHIWTVGLAQRDDMTPMSPAQYQRWLDKDLEKGVAARGGKVVMRVDEEEQIEEQAAEDEAAPDLEKKVAQTGLIKDDGESEFLEDGEENPEVAVTQEDIAGEIGVDEDGYLEENDILSVVEPAKEQTVVSDAMKTQEMIKEDEIKELHKFRKTNTLEAYMLEKYKVNLIPMDDLPELREQAIAMIDELAKHGKLFIQAKG